MLHMDGDSGESLRYGDSMWPALPWREGEVPSTAVLELNPEASLLRACDDTLCPSPVEEKNKVEALRLGDHVLSLACEGRSILAFLNEDLSTAQSALRKSANNRDQGSNDP